MSDFLQSPVQLESRCQLPNHLELAPTKAKQYKRTLTDDSMKTTDESDNASFEDFEVLELPKDQMKKPVQIPMRLNRV